MAGQEVAEDIWAGLISDTGTIGGVETLRNAARDALRNSSPNKVNSTDIARAANPVFAPSRALANDIPSDNARNDLGGNIDTSNLTSVLNDFMRLYTKTRNYRFRQYRTSWGTGNPNGQAADYFKLGYQASLGGVTGSFTGSLIEDEIDRSDYETVIGQLRPTIDSQVGGSGSGGTVTYCHNSCHSACHSSRGRR